MQMEIFWDHAQVIIKATTDYDEVCTDYNVLIEDTIRMLGERQG